MKKIAIILVFLTNVVFGQIDSTSIYENKGEYNKELSYLLKTLRIANTDSSIVRLNGAIGWVYTITKDYSKALEYYTKSLSICKELSNKVYEEEVYIGLGCLYGEQRKPIIANFYFTKALTIAEKINDEPGVQNLLLNIGGTYSAEGKYNLAFPYLFQGLNHAIKLKDDFNTLVSYQNIAATFEKVGKVDSAIYYQNLGLKLAIDKKLKSYIVAAYKALSEYYAKINNYKVAYDNHLSYSNLYDSLFSEEKNKQIVEMQTKYETEKKEEEIKNLQQKSLIQTTINNHNSLINKIYLSVIILGILFSIFAYYSYKKIQIGKKIIESKNKDITDSINYAAGIQKTILPILNHRAKVFFQPKDIVSGDFFWHKVNGEHEYYAVADCTGHGVPGALLSMLCNELLESASKIYLYPHEILQIVNNELKERMELLGRQDGMEISLVKLNSRTKHIMFAGANRPMYLVSDGNLTEFKGTKAGIGGSTPKSQKFESHCIEPSISSTQIYLTTDGFVDQFGQNNKKFGSKQLKETLSLSQPSTIELEEIMKNWMGAQEQIDDICVMNINF